jgi:hypothetical protein
MVCEPNEQVTRAVELKVNGEEVELNSFAQNIISHTVIGMVKSLRGVGEVETVSLAITKRGG